MTFCVHPVVALSFPLCLSALMLSQDMSGKLHSVQFGSSASPAGLWWPFLCQTQQADRHLAHSRPRSHTVAGLFGRWKGVTHTWGWCPDTSCEGMSFHSALLFCSTLILFSCLCQELLCFSSLTQLTGLIRRVFLQTSAMIRRFPSVSHELFLISTSS